MTANRRAKRHVRAQTRLPPHHRTHSHGPDVLGVHVRACVVAAVACAGSSVITLVQAAEIADLLWQRDPLAFLGLCASCKERGMTLLERIQQRAKELRT